MEEHRVKANLLEFKADKLNWGSGLRVTMGLFVPLFPMSALNLTQYWANLAYAGNVVGTSARPTLGAPIG